MMVRAFPVPCYVMEFRIVQVNIRRMRLKFVMRQYKNTHVSTGGRQGTPPMAGIISTQMAYVGSFTHNWDLYICVY